MSSPNINQIPILRLDYNEDEIEFIQSGIADIMKSGYLTMHKNVDEFEKKFADFIGVKYAIGVNSGTSALEIPLRALNLEGKSIIVPTNTFMATPLAAIHAGAKIVFVDVMPENLSIDPDDLRRKIRNDTAGVILVHIGGIISPYLHEIEKICQDNGLFLIEDAAHAHGSSIKGKKAGALGVCGSFSFYPTKVLNTAEGGMITTDDKTIFEKSLIFREHGKKDHNFNVHTELGYNWRFSELHALLGLQQMKIVNDIISKRQKIAKFYNDQLNQTSGITLIEIPEHIECSYYKYIVYLDKKYDRHVFKNQLKKEFNISLPGEVYAEGCHNQPVFKKYPELVLNKTDEHFPGAKFVSDRQICLPLYPSLTNDELMYVVDSFKFLLDKY